MHTVSVEAEGLHTHNIYNKTVFETYSNKVAKSIQNHATMCQKSIKIHEKINQKRTQNHQIRSKWASWQRLGATWGFGFELGAITPRIAQSSWGPCWVQNLSKFIRINQELPKLVSIHQRQSESIEIYFEGVGCTTVIIAQAREVGPKPEFV